MNKFNYKYLTPFKWFIQENFPFIEADFDAITEWQLFEKLGNEINKIINSQNQVGTEMEILSNAFLELQEYINNYFDNLDVQEEINNKLNEMAESGELAEIISQYLQLQITFTYNTVNDMINAENLTDGSYAKTLGFHSLNDGGKANYIIREIENTDVVDNMFLFALVNSNNLVAEKLDDKVLNIKSIGAYGDNINDDTAVLRKAFNSGKTVYIPNGEYKQTERIDITIPVSIIGENKYKTKIVNEDNIADNFTSFIFSNNVNNISVKNLTFDGGEQTVNRHILSFIGCKNLELKDLYCTGGLGYVTRLNDSENITIKNCEFDTITGVDGNPRRRYIRTKFKKHNNR